MGVSGRGALGALLGALLSACGSTTGAGQGVLVSGGSVQAERGGAPVRFAWEVHHEDADQGTITATLRDGSTYHGHLERVYARTEAIAQNPYFGATYHEDWQKRSAEQPYWEPGYEIELENRYTDRVMAQLHSDAGGRMSCNLVLTDPAQGMSGGAKGDCRLSNGEKIHDVVLAH